MKNNKLKNLFCTLSFCLISLVAFAENGYEIKVRITDYDRDTLYLAYHIMDKVMLKDTAILDKTSGFFTFKGDKTLESGVYVLVIPPATLHLEMTICATEQHFTIVTQKDEPHKKVDLKNSIDNDIFFKYVQFIGEKSQVANEARTLIKTDSLAAVRQFQTLDKEVKNYRKRLIEKYPETVAAMLIKSTIEVEQPVLDTKLDKNERDLATYYFAKQHYFDNYDMGNPAMLRTSVLFPKVDSYIENMTPQYPDSIIASLDRVFDLIRPNKETFQNYFLHYYNKYLQSQYVGFDAVWVHLTKKYIETGLCYDLITVKDSARLIEKANKLLPLLIGKTAPNFPIFQQDGSTSHMHDIKARYTVLYFYRTDCGHCNKQSPLLVEFFKKSQAKNRDVKVVTVCTRTGESAAQCWDYVKEKGFSDFINTAHPEALGRTLSVYNIELTPTVFVLDENKTIRMKNIAADQLDAVLDRIILEDAEKMKK